MNGVILAWAFVVDNKLEFRFTMTDVNMFAPSTPSGCWYSEAAIMGCSGVRTGGVRGSNPPPLTIGKI